MCELCGGLGYIRCRPAKEELDDGPPWLAATADFLRAFGLIERHGIEGAFRLLSLGDEEAELDPAFVEALEVFSGELDRLESEDRKAKAERDRKESKRREAQAWRPQKP